MGGYDPTFDDVSNFLNFPNDSDDEDGPMNSPSQEQKSIMTDNVKDTSTPLSPPASAEGDAIEEDDLEDDELYAIGPRESIWKMRRDSASLDSPVNPRWLHSSENSRPPPSLEHHPSPPTSDDAKTPNACSDQRRTALETIQERNESLVQTAANPKTSKSFPLLPDLLKLKTAEDEDEKILASEEGRKLNPRERRQLRNKVSARNFRVRRKEYIGHLESLVESQSEEIEQLRQSLNAMQLENTQLRQESGFLRSIALNQQQQPQPSTPPTDPVMSHPNKDVNPNAFDWPLAYDGSQSPTQSTSKFNDRPMYNGHVHAYGVRVPEVHFDKPHVAANPAPPLPPAPTPQYAPGSPRPSQEAPKTPPGQPGFPPGTEGYPHMLQAVTYLYDYIVKASGNGMQPPQPAQPFGGYPMPNAWQPQPQQWGDAKIMGAPAMGYPNQCFNGNWGWNGGPPGPTV